MSQPNPPPSNRTLLWRAVKQVQPGLSDQAGDTLLERAAQQERDLVLNHGLSSGSRAGTGERGPFPLGAGPVGGRPSVRTHARRSGAYSPAAHVAKRLPPK